MQDATGCAERIRTIYGADLAADAGVLHVVAVWSPPGASPRVIRIGAHSPRSPTDAFVLRLARARVDAIVTTGRNLRDEPGLTHRLGGPHAEALAAWRSKVVGRNELPRSLVLTRGRDVDLDHPLFRTAHHPILFTGESAPASLDAAAALRDIDLVRHPAPDARAAIAYLRAAHAARSISIEAGPSTALPLYDPPVAVDELMLSTFDEPDLPEEARGAAFPGIPWLRRLLPRTSSPWACEEASGHWTFRRLWRE
jgi:riboflavin biosynthesis pyrimidine reductase